MSVSRIMLALVSGAVLCIGATLPGCGGAAVEPAEQTAGASARARSARGRRYSRRAGSRGVVVRAGGRRPAGHDGRAVAVDEAAIAAVGTRPSRGRQSKMQLRMTRPEVCRAWRPHARAAARPARLSPDLLLAVAWVESGFRRRARSSAGARGPLQLMPRTSRAFGCSAPEDPACAFPAAAALLRRLLQRFDGRVVYALCAYNAGAGRISRAWRAGELPFNIWYAERVLAAKARLERRGCRAERR